MPYLREQDRKEISTITTGMRNSFGAGVKAIQAWRAYWPLARGLFPRRTRENRNPLARRRNGVVRRLGKSDSSKTIENRRHSTGVAAGTIPRTKSSQKRMDSEY